MQPRDTPNVRRALELAITAAFFARGSAAHVARTFSTAARTLHAADVKRIWNKAKAAGELPRLRRPAKGPRRRHG